MLCAADSQSHISPRRVLTFCVESTKQAVPDKPSPHILRAPKMAAAMEPNKIKEEVTALQVRFDALRGYL